MTNFENQCNALRNILKTVQSKFLEKELIRMPRLDDDRRNAVREGKMKNKKG